MADSRVEEAVRNVLADPSSLPQGFKDWLVRHQDQHGLPKKSPSDWYYATPVAPATAHGMIAGVPFQNGWGNVALADGSYSLLRYRIDFATNSVQLVGAIDGGTIGTVCITLPSQFRPAADVFSIISSADGTRAFSVEIQASTGNVTVLAGIATGTGGGSGGGGITDLTSTGSTITVTAPTGPTTNVDLPNSGVTAATYGDGAHVAQVHVNAQGVVTSASSIAISGTVGGFVKLFDQTLGADTATIDTGANGIPAGYAGLLIYVRARRDGAVFSGGLGLQFNGDAAANYDYLWTDDSAGSVFGTVSNSQNNTKVMELPGASVRANTFGLAQCWIHGYDETTTYKSVTSHGGFSDGSSHGELVNAISSWNSTAAINQITLTVGAGNKLKQFSRMTIWGLL